MASSHVSCRFLLAADGASSGIRKQFNSEYSGTSASSQWYIVDAVAASPAAEAALLQVPSSHLNYNRKPLTFPAAMAALQLLLRQRRRLRPRAHALLSLPPPLGVPAASRRRPALLRRPPPPRRRRPLPPARHPRGSKQFYGSFLTALTLTAGAIHVSQSRGVAVDVRAQRGAGRRRCALHASVQVPSSPEFTTANP
jgi:hypothetical protein